MTEQHRDKDEARPGQAPQEQTTIPDPGYDSTLERVEVLAAGAQERDNIEEEGLGEKLAELAVTTEEEVDALRINLLQEDERASMRSGVVIEENFDEPWTKPLPDAT